MVDFELILRRQHEENKFILYEKIGPLLFIFFGIVMIRL